MNECNYPTDICTRFWGKVIIPKDYKSECWVYTYGATDQDGYGIFAIESDWPTKAHRFAYQYYKGPIKPGMIIMHKCDNPPCCSPYHIIQRTIAINNTDRSKKGRSAIGSRAGNSKLTEDIVRQIRFDMKHNNYSNHMIARKYNIGPSNASRIRQYRIWKHIIV
jgi:hypothetical protein